jgi:cellulose synthase/poly-beta-1,6-N-acetylglucosamine synthase-like glycosyltransferase
LKNHELIVRNLSRIWFWIPLAGFTVLITLLLSLPFLPQNIFSVIGGTIFLYWIIRGCLFSIFSLIGFFYHTKNGNKNWLEKLKNDFNDNELPEHLIVIPHSDEDYSILKRSINSILKQNYPLERIHIAITIEESSVKKSKKISQHVNRLENDFKGILKERLMIFIHPELEDEAKGAAANRTWGAKNAVRSLEESKISLDNFLITSPDADTVFQSNYLAECSYKWLKDSKSKNHFYQTGFYKFDNNFWHVPIFIRSISNLITISILSTSTFEGKGRLTFSCFTVSLNLIKEVGYWDTSYPVDDTMIYFKFYNITNGNLKCRTLSSAISVDAVYDRNYLLNLKKQYFQFFRWGYGALAFSLFTKICINNKKISIIKKIGKGFRLFETFFLSKLISGYIFIIFYKLDQFQLNRKTINLLAILLLINLVMLTLSKILVTRKKDHKVMFLLPLIFHLPVSFFNLFTFFILPFAHAAIELTGYKSTKSNLQWVDKLYNIED